MAERGEDLRWIAELIPPPETEEELQEFIEANYPAEGLGLITTATDRDKLLWVDEPNHEGISDAMGRAANEASVAKGLGEIMRLERVRRDGWEVVRLDGVQQAHVTYKPVE